MALTLQVLNAGSTTAAVGGTNVWISPNAGATYAGKAGLVKNIMLTNVSAIVLTIDVKVRMQPNATLFYCSPKAMQIAAGAQIVLDNEITLNLSPTTNPDAIQLTVTGAAGGNNIEWVVNGLLRDI
jgi:hypothetical protein